MRTLVCAAALLVFLIANLQGSEAGYEAGSKAQCPGNFQLHCKNIALSADGVLSAYCAPIGVPIEPLGVSTWINLDKYLGDYDGALAKGTDFSTYCEKVEITIGTGIDMNKYVSMKAECKKKSYNKDGESYEEYVWTSYQLSNNLYVDDYGYLQWNNYC